jgi:hypothetical protein
MQNEDELKEMAKQIVDMASQIATLVEIVRDGLDDYWYDNHRVEVDAAIGKALGIDYHTTSPNARREWE